jgi:MFS family permease
MYLGITVLATIMLYYELYVGGSVSTLILPKFHMSFTFFVYATAVGNLIGAFGSLFAGLTDRLGRTNIVVVGLIITAIFVVIVLPEAPNKWAFIIEGWVVGTVEGICLVATPALIRDFSPQVGRGSAMGFWTSGPVLGSLIVAVVASNTLPANPGLNFWTHEYHICGIAGIVVALIALFGLRELSPGLRDQLMVTMQDRALIEAKAKGLDVESALRNPWRQLLKPDVLISATGISVFLLIYYTAVGFGVIYFATIFGETTKNANGLGNWQWGFNVIAVILFGIVSDKLRVRKPFMVVGGVAAAVMTILWLGLIGHHPGYYHLAAFAAILSFCLGVAYVPWMASFTETVEAYNPALTATGLAIWGWIIRAVVFGSTMIIPSVIHSMTPLVEDGPAANAIVAQYPEQVGALSSIQPSTLAALEKNPADPQAGAAAVGQIMTKLHVSQTQAIAMLKSVPSLPPADGVLLGKVATAAKQAPGQWKDWYWICFGCMIFFLATVPLMRGRWSPRKAREDEAAHEAMVQEEMAKLGVTETA